MTAVVIIVVVVALAACLLVVRRMKRKAPAQVEHPDERRGQVDGATHMGGGRSVMPRRDAPVTGDEAPDEPTVAVRKPTSPLDR
jgi:hypothetical protein